MSEHIVLQTGGLQLEKAAIYAVAKRLGLAAASWDIIRVLEKPEWRHARLIKRPCKEGEACRRSVAGEHKAECYRPIRVPGGYLPQLLGLVREKYLAPQVSTTLLGGTYHSFLPERSVLTMAREIKQGKFEHLLRVDLKNAYGQISRRRIMAALRYSLGVEQEEAKVLAQLMRIHGEAGVPQGAETSPFIYLLVLSHLVDTRLRPALPEGIKILCYADDFVFASKRPFSRERVQGVREAFRVAGLSINHRKTRRLRVSGGATLPGIVVYVDKAGTVRLGVTHSFKEKAREVFIRARGHSGLRKVALGHESWLRFVYSGGDRRDDSWSHQMPKQLQEAYWSWENDQG